MLLTLGTVATVVVAAAWNPGPAGSRPAGSLPAPSLSGRAVAAGGAFHTEGPPPGYTGGFDEPTCRSCHAEFDLNVGGGLALEGLPDAYEPGGTYVVSVVLRSSGMERAGFQAAARFGSPDDAEAEPQGGRQAGLLESLDPRTAVVPDSTGHVLYVQHAAAGAEVEAPDMATWSFQWTAPEEGEAVAVIFHAAANSANGDNSPLGDLVYSTRRRIQPRSPHPEGPPRR